MTTVPITNNCVSHICDIRPVRVNKLLFIIIIATLPLQHPGSAPAKGGLIRIERFHFMSQSRDNHANLHFGVQLRVHLGVQLIVA